MDSDRFDWLTRSFSSRRTALGGILGGLGVLLGLSEDVDAHNYLERCGRIRDPERRQICRLRARTHDRRHQYCLRQAPLLACRNRYCGTVRDGCGRLRSCGACQPGYACLRNGNCALVCDASTNSGCPDYCTCANYREVGTGGYHCVFPDAPELLCTIAKDPCQTSADCRGGTECQMVPCGDDELTGRCVSLCG